MKVTFETDVLCISHHPTLPQFAVALVTGHVFAYSYAREDPSRQTLLWSTRRHKKACRAIAYSLDGASIVSAGADGVVKLASSETGKVMQKWSASVGEESEVEAINAVAWMNEGVFCTADDAGVIKAFNGMAGKEATRTFAGTHLDYVSSLMPLDGKYVLSTSGDGTLAIHDLRANTTAKAGSESEPAAVERDRRKALHAQSDDQEDDLTCCLLLKTHAKRQKILVGTASGVLLLFNRSDIGDCSDRILAPVVSQSSSSRGGGGGGGKKKKEGGGKGKRDAGDEIGVECLAKVDEDTVLVGGTDGRVRLLNVLPNRWLREVCHFESGEPVQDVVHADGRVFAASGNEVRIHPLAETGADDGTQDGATGEQEDGDSGDAFSDSDSDADSEVERAPKKKKVKKTTTTTTRPAMQQQQKKKDTFFDDL